MMFNQRRQSQDRGLREYIKDMTKNAKVFMNAYSKELYQEFPDAVVCEDFLDRADKGDFCLVENQGLKLLEKKIEKIIVFRWKKVYPSDMKLDVNLKNWNLIEKEELEGSSHHILKEIYTKGE